MYLKLVISCFFVFRSLVTGAYCESITIDLKNHVPDTPQSVYKSFETISNISTSINVKNINENIGFFVIQIHTYIENVTLSYGPEDSHNAIAGTNIGLIYGDSDTETTFYLYRSLNQTLLSDNVTVLVVIVVYHEKDPVPGGCNLTFDTIIAPYQIVTYDKDTITVSSQPPSGYGVSCDFVSDTITVDHYHMFLTEHDSNSSVYFEGILKMLTVNDIKTHGTIVSPTDGFFKYQRLFSNYKSTGEVFAIVATLGLRSSAYIPAVSYGCDITTWSEDCYGPASILWEFMYVLILFCGVVLCFIGHLHFRLTVYIIGCGFGLMISYVIFSGNSYFENHPEGKTTIAVIIALLVGVPWLKLWTKREIPLLTVSLTYLLAGMLLASTIFYAGLADLEMFNSNITYWVTFACIILAATVLWMLATVQSHIFACSLLGSYALIYALSYYFGGNLQYILINVYRRVVVRNFNMAETAAPFQTLDFLHVSLWTILLILGFSRQNYHQESRPPFPVRRGPWHSPGDIEPPGDHHERTPLLFNS